MESGIHGFGIRNPTIVIQSTGCWNPVCCDGTRNPWMWNPESKTLLDYLTLGEIFSRHQLLDSAPIIIK
ncbi:hypothetical protein [Ulvibacterium sp.]|uniref:hypothetical protein n=1 Tax=Ulvibacterium sp. TaxID=2665914 RepID=UPI0026305973|nr:hypothetical protein [Ulvibacterium sp.]